jgi:uncharacterized membrane protein
MQDTPANPEFDVTNEIESLKVLRKLKPARHKFHLKGRGLGDKVSDALTKIVGSWAFILTQAVLLLLWLTFNVISLNANHWDPYPFILLNLLLSFQAAFTAPIIMMSQNRQNIIDRQKAEHDFAINVKAELEIELLHQKIDAMRETEIKQLIDIIQDLERKNTK